MKLQRRTCPPPILVSCHLPQPRLATNNNIILNKARSREQMKMRNFASCSLYRLSTTQHKLSMLLRFTIHGNEQSLRDERDALRRIYGQRTGFCAKEELRFFLPFYLKRDSDSHAPFSHIWFICFLVLLRLPSCYSSAHLDRPLATPASKSPCICG
jgi:hypothetical protein